MIYFCATSVFHLLMIIYLLETEYKDSTQNKTLILLDHVTNLIRCYPKIKNSGLWNDVICVHTDKETTENIAKQLDQIEFQEGDKLHILGKEFVSFYLLYKAEKKATCILTDEGVLANVNIKNRIRIDYHEEWFQGRVFDFSCIDELWLMDARVSENDEKIKIKDLKMQEILKQKDIRERYVSKLELVFPREDCVAKIPQICFFDVYYLQMYHCISEEFEQYLLEQLADKLSGYDFAIKPHPGERNYEKYRNVKQKVYKDSYIPWEVLRFYETECPHKKRIVISYSTTGAIFHDKLLFDDGTQMIFLNKIYEKFCTNPIDTYNILPQFIKIYGGENVYFPESFTELEEIVSSILKKEPQSFELDAFENEQREYLTFFTEYYKKNWELKPSLNNYTTLLTLRDGRYEMVAEQKIYTEDGNFKFVFPVSFNAKEHVKWYIARSRKVSLRIGQISCINGSEVFDVNLNALFYNLGEDRPDGYKDMVILEPSVEFDLPCEKADKIIISGEWQFDFSYDGLIEILQKNVTRYDQHIKLLHGDIDERDNHLAAIYKDIKERDNHLKIVYKKLEKSEIHVGLLKEDIAERDEKIKKMQEEIKQWKEGKSQQQLFPLYKDNFWRRLFNKKK
ncbi:hypothetical protein [Lacrimispora sp. 38-1]|uniref:hypothetical protein n=1 Tax=Lacrimispora sp. 38-1 TaxID=3125778 RepID=UPI003CF6370E